MKITYDPGKNQRNIAARGLSFDRACEFDFETAMTKVDQRYAYGETRFISLGYLDARLHVLCFVEVVSGIRVISFRKANKREVDHYARQETID
ncbi:hypothetical protein FHW67_004159 [Herbaspirillum sp. Sphag1AN]|jgi:uncharacterized protein|uniref:BrnT family toxin n=1 Tax=unclassified Herbaspirillum TaxID=2624150 RepID=UPI00161D9607|nr:MULTISPECIES: BrnT family toxin [unclassified Herbaspirillum]MBB3214836.1 hypothetical protein [Herbaspirillum sp. Sphag1AN]MBB3248030.1 hypothetical protein [Herbaspirillum sp. Sphag64]